MPAYVVREYVVEGTLVITAFVAAFFVASLVVRRADGPKTYVLHAVARSAAALLLGGIASSGLVASYQLFDLIFTSPFGTREQASESLLAQARLILGIAALLAAAVVVRIEMWYRRAVGLGGRQRAEEADEDTEWRLADEEGRG